MIGVAAQNPTIEISTSDVSAIQEFVYFTGPKWESKNGAVLNANLQVQSISRFQIEHRFATVVEKNSFTDLLDTTPNFLFTWNGIQYKVKMFGGYRESHSVESIKISYVLQEIS